MGSNSFRVRKEYEQFVESEDHTERGFGLLAEELLLSWPLRGVLKFHLEVLLKVVGEGGVGVADEGPRRRRREPRAVARAHVAPVRRELAVKAARAHHSKEMERRRVPLRLAARSVRP